MRHGKSVNNAYCALAPCPPSSLGDSRGTVSSLQCFERLQYRVRVQVSSVPRHVNCLLPKTDRLNLCPILSYWAVNVYEAENFSINR